MILKCAPTITTVSVHIYIRCIYIHQTCWTQIDSMGTWIPGWNFLWNFHMEWSVLLYDISTLRSRSERIWTQIISNHKPISNRKNLYRWGVTNLSKLSLGAYHWISSIFAKMGVTPKSSILFILIEWSTFLTIQLHRGTPIEPPISNQLSSAHEYSLLHAKQPTMRADPGRYLSSG